MEKKNGVVDLSSFLLVEGSADSEAECELLKLCQDVIMVCDYDGDDAESCSCDYSDALSFLDNDQDCRDSDEGDNKDNCHDKQSWCKMWLGNEELECMSTEDGEEANDGICLTKKIIDQMEDRLFWETCLAVGYP